MINGNKLHPLLMNVFTEAPIAGAFFIGKYHIKISCFSDRNFVLSYR